MTKKSRDRRKSYRQLKSDYKYFNEIHNMFGETKTMSLEEIKIKYQHDTK